MLQATEEARRNPIPEPQWRRGAACTIDQGAFSGREGVVVDVGGSSARIGLFIFGQLRDVTVPIDSLMPRRAT
jgi:transcription antitermination factor NusG